MSKKLIFIFLISSVSAIAGEEFILSKSIVNSYAACFNLDFENAQKQLLEDKKQNKSNAFRYLIDNYIDAIKLLIEDDPLYYKQALARKSKRLEALEDCNKESVFYYYILSDIHLQWAFVRIKFGDQIKAVNDLRLAAKYNKLNGLKFPTFILTYKNDAVIQAIASAIPPKFYWIGKQLNIKGNITTAEKKIEDLLHFTDVNKDFSFLNAELNLIKLFIQLNLSGKLIEDVNLSENADEIEFKPLILKFYIAINYIKQGKLLQAKQLLNEVEKNKKGIGFNYLKYLFAEIYIGEKLEDNGNLDLFLNRTKGNSYIKAALRKKAWLAVLSGDVVKYQDLMRRILTEGSENTDDDKQALFEAKSKFIPNKFLLASRMYFDGGQYFLSLQQLSLIDIQSLRFEDKSELYYRRGRCFQRLNKLENAQRDFANSIAISKLTNPYIYSVSCFYQAKIYEQLLNNTLAVKHYNMVIEAKQHPYKTSLDAKSKASLQRLNVH
jgi:hypothetical protein